MLRKVMFMTDRRNNRHRLSRRFLVSSCLQSTAKLQNSFLTNVCVRVYWSLNNYWNFSVFFDICETTDILVRLV